MNKVIRILFIISICTLQSILCNAGETTLLDSIIYFAENGDPYYQGVLGAIYRRGERGEINYAEAEKWLTLSANKGNPIGCYNLAVLYESKILGAADTARIKHLYEKAYAPMLDLARQGNSRAQVNLGYILETGIVAEENLQRALRWYEEAARTGNPRAQFIVGYKYYYGWGYEKNPEIAAHWFNKSADQNYSDACHFLGNMYANGYGVPKNDDTATGYFRRAESVRKNSEYFDPEAGVYSLNGVKYEGDKIIPNLLPPDYLFEIKQGSCGEACLWSIINSDSFRVTQFEINRIGGDPGRGLQTFELAEPLKECGIEYIDKMHKSYFKYIMAFFNPYKLFSSQDDCYRNYLYNEIIEKLKKGHPIILGVKIYPDKHFFWDSDHFILLVGYNENTKELIFNDFTQRKRIDAEKLLDKTTGFSLINRYNFHNYIEILR